MAKSYRELVKENLALHREEGKYKVLLAFIKKHKITNTLKLKHYLNLREAELKDYLKSAQKSPTMTTLRRRQTQQLAWISFVKKHYLKSL